MQSLIPLMHLPASRPLPLYGSFRVSAFAILATALSFISSLLIFTATASAAMTARLTTGSGAPGFYSAATMFADNDAQTIQLVGNVVVQFEGELIRCDRAIINEKTKTISAEGNLIIASPSAYVEGKQAELSYRDNTGVVFDGFVKSGQVIFEGRVIRKIGPMNYVAEQAQYTACTTCPAAWSFTGASINAEIGGYAFIKNSFLKVGGIPIFWLPYLIVPLKSERQTGFLFPSYDIEGENFAIGLPFFWAISRSQDLTLTPKFYTLRGLKGLLNYRYILAEDSGGETNAGFFLFSDSIFANDSQLPNRPGAERSGRWYLTHSHSLVLPGGFVNTARMNFVSDLRYPRDFPEEIGGRGDAALENSLSLAKNSESLHTSIQAKYFINQLKSDPLDGNADAVHRFPEIRQSGVDRSVLNSRLFLRWDIAYVNFAREDFAYDDVVVAADGSRSIDRTRGAGGTNSGSFQSGTDLIRTGQRLDIKPEFSLPFRIGQYIDVLPTLQARHTQYSFNVTAPAGSSFDTLPNRQSVKPKIAFRTPFSRVYDLENEPSETDEGIAAGTTGPAPASTEPESGIFAALQPKAAPPKPIRLKHEFEPEFAVSGIPWLQQTDSAFFGENTLAPIYLESQPVSNADFLSAKGLQFDYEDRITQRNIMSLVLNNRLVKKSWSGDAANYRQIISVKNGTNYEFDKRDREMAGNFSDIHTMVDVRLDHFETNAIVRYFPLHQVANTSARILFRDDRGDYIQLSYAQSFSITETISDANKRTEENIGVTVGYTHRYATVSTSANFNPVAYSPLNFEVKSWNATLALRPPGSCWSLNATVGQALGDKIQFSFKPNFSFGGSF